MMILFWFYRGKKTWLRDASRFSLASWSWTTSLFSNQATYGTLWWPSLPLACSPPKPFLWCMNYTTDGAVQQGNDYCSDVCGMVVWRYSQLFQISWFQEKSEDLFECCWENMYVCAIFRNGLTCLYGNNTRVWFLRSASAIALLCTPQDFPRRVLFSMPRRLAGQLINSLKAKYQF